MLAALRNHVLSGALVVLGLLLGVTGWKGGVEKPSATRPDIVVDEEVINFGTVGQGDEVHETVTVSNAGTQALILQKATFAPDSGGESPIGLNLPMQLPLKIQPEESLTLDLVFAPLDTAEHRGVLRIRSNDPDSRVVEVQVSGQGSTCPVAVAEITWFADIRHLDRVPLNGSSSKSGTPGRNVVAWEWWLEEQPQGSNATLSAPNKDQTGLICDLVGVYQVRLGVLDNEGIRSCRDAVLRFSARAGYRPHVQLVWDHPTADLDLHLLREGGVPFSEEDCFHSNMDPEWPPDGQAGNGHLDWDDTDGFGPENITVYPSVPLGSGFTVMVHYYSKNTDGDASTTASVRIYVGSQKVAETSQKLDEAEVMWTVLKIEWGHTEAELPGITEIGLVEPFKIPAG